MSRKLILVAFVALLAITAGCLGGDDAGDESSIEDQANGAETVDRQNGADGDERSTASAAVDVDDRQLIRTASLSVTVDSFETARANLTGEANTAGGYLSDADERTHERGNETWRTGTLTFRVPADEFESFYASTEAEGTVTSAETETEDVTDQLVDLEARLENHEQQRDRLRGLYEDADETEEVLAVEERLSEVQEEIERLEAERESLTDQVAYSTVTVALEESPPKAETSKEASWYETSVVSAFLASIGGVVTVTRATVVAAAYAAPYLLAFGGPIALLYGANRRFRPGRRFGTTVDPRPDDSSTTDEAPTDGDAESADETE